MLRLPILKGTARPDVAQFAIYLSFDKANCHRAQRNPVAVRKLATGPGRWRRRRLPGGSRADALLKGTLLAVRDDQFANSGLGRSVHNRTFRIQKLLRGQSRDRCSGSCGGSAVCLVFAGASHNFSKPSPLYPRKRTFAVQLQMSAKGQSGHRPRKIPAKRPQAQKACLDRWCIAF